MAGKQPPANPFSMMIHLFATFVLALPFFADTIGNVEYSLPPSKQHWQLVADKKTEKNVISTTRRYVPEDRASVAIAEESFTAHSSNLPGHEGDNDGSIKERIQQMFPETTVTVEMIKKDPEADLYTWSVNSSEVSFFGVSKHFHIDGGTVNLLYKTTNKETFEADKQAWIDSLKEARLKK